MPAALLLIDLQNDFPPGGALAVPHGHEVIPAANEVQRKFDLIVATQDWHPPDGSFAANHAGKQAGGRSHRPRGPAANLVDLRPGDTEAALAAM